MKRDQSQVRSLYRNDFVAFADRAFCELNAGREYLHNGYIDVIADKLEQCRSGAVRRLIINLPPRSLKSHLISVCFPAWLLGHNPGAKIICASYAQALANNLASQCLSVVNSKWYRDIFPMTRLSSPRPPVDDFETTARGFRLASSVGGALLGRGGDYIVIDDPLKPAEAFSEPQRKSVNDWYDHTVFSRLDLREQGCIILVMQRLHEDDLVGHVLKQEQWESAKFAAIAEEDESYSAETPHGRTTFTRKRGEPLHPEWESLQSLEQTRAVVGEYFWSAQFQQNPAPLSGGYIKIHWFKQFRPEERPPEFELVFQSWDTANKATELSNYTVCTTWGLINNHLYLLEVFRMRLNYPDLRRMVKEQAAKYRARIILIEDKASGTPLIQDLIADGVHGVKGYQPKMDKVMRMYSVSSTIENGFVHIPEKAPWAPEYMHEMALFPNGRFSDQVDSTSQALDWAKQRTSRVPSVQVIQVPTRYTPFASHTSALAQASGNRGFGRW